MIPTGSARARPRGFTPGPGPAVLSTAMSETGTGPGRERLHWMDLLRGGAVLLVIVHHLRLIQQIWDGATPWAMIELSEGFAPFRMPALLFASGMLLERSLCRPTGRFLAGKVRGLLWPWLVWSVVMLPLLGWDNAREPLWWLDGMYTWFLAALFLYYVIGLLTRRIHPGWVALAALLAWAALPLLEITPTMAGPRPDKFLFYAVYFFAGAALRPLLARGPLPWAVTLPGLALGGAWALHAARADVEPVMPLLAQAVVVLSVLGAIGVLQRLPRWRVLRPLEWMGRNSIVPYLVHLPVLEILGRHVDLPASAATFALYYAITLGICALAILLRPATGFLYAFPARRAGAADAAPAQARPGTRAPVVAADGGAARR